MTSLGIVSDESGKSATTETTFCANGEFVMPQSTSCVAGLSV